MWWRNVSFFDVSKFGENSFVITLVVLSIESLKKQTKFEIDSPMFDFCFEKMFSFKIISSSEVLLAWLVSFCQRENDFPLLFNVS